VRAAFKAYQRAVLSGDGSGATARVSRGTLDYYGELLGLVLRGREDAVRAAPLATRIRVVAIRHQMRVERLLGLSAESLFANGVERGWLSPGVAGVSLGRIEVEDLAATGVRLAAGREAGRFEFDRERSGWRVDLRANLEAESAELRELAREQGVAEDELVLALVQAASRVEVPDAIWQPLLGAPEVGAPPEPQTSPQRPSP
jgi:hypothetical protein